MNNYKEIKRLIEEADAILIGASNGLSITEGLHLFADNRALEELFGDYKRKYRLRNLLQGMGAQWPTEEEKWIFWSRLIHHYCCNYTPTQVMKNLKTIIGEKDYFVITTNGEYHFELSGFEPEKICELEGNWATMQCSNACHDKLYPTLELAKKIALAEQNGDIPSELIPYCPKCGAPMQVHMEIDRNFIPPVEEQKRLQKFLEKYHNKNIVVLELGIGWRNQLIKSPLMRLVNREPHATYVTSNLGEIYIADDIKDKSFGLDGYLDKILEELS